MAENKKESKEKTKQKDKKPEIVFEREYTIPLRNGWKKVPRYKRANKAIKTIKEFLVRHMKIYDRDLNKIKIDRNLNEAVWFRGIKKPPIKIKVKVVKEGDIVKAELFEVPEKLKFKRLREEKREQKASGVIEKKKAVKKTEEEEKKLDDKEKAKAGEEVSKQIEKQRAKQIKHQVGGKTKQPKRQIRKALEK